MDKVAQEGAAPDMIAKSIDAAVGSMRVAAGGGDYCIDTWIKRLETSGRDPVVVRRMVADMAQMGGHYPSEAAEEALDALCFLRLTLRARGSK